MFRKDSSPKQCEECSLNTEGPTRNLLQRSRTWSAKLVISSRGLPRKHVSLRVFIVEKLMKIFTKVWVQLTELTIETSRERAREKQTEHKLLSSWCSLSCWHLPLSTLSWSGRRWQGHPGDAVYGISVWKAKRGRERWKTDLGWVGIEDNVLRDADGG